MKKEILLAPLLAIMLWSPAAYAAWGSVGQVVSITQSNNAGVNATRTVIELNVSCPVAGGNSGWYIRDADPNKEIMVKMLMAALLAGRDVQLEYANDGDGCRVRAVKLL